LHRIPALIERSELTLHISSGAELAQLNSRRASRDECLLRIALRHNLWFLISHFYLLSEAFASLLVLHVLCSMPEIPQCSLTTALMILSLVLALPQRSAHALRVSVPA